MNGLITSQAELTPASRTALKMLRRNSYVKANPARWMCRSFLVAALGACSWTEDQPGGDGPAAETAETTDGAYPNLADVPERPQPEALQNREDVAQGLVADRSRARYSETPLAQSTAAGAPPPPPVPPSTPPSVSQAPAPQVAAPPVPAAPVARAQPPVASAALPTAPPPPALVAPPAPMQPSQQGGVYPQVAYGAPVGAPVVPPGVPATVIYFAHGSASIGGAESAKIRQVAEFRAQYNRPLRIVGHASMRTGNMDPATHQRANLEISWQRATAVADALRSAGVPGDMMLITALADSQPIYQESMPLGEAGNRRVEIYLE